MSFTNPSVTATTCPSNNLTLTTQDRSRQDFRRFYHEVKYLGSGDNGNTFAAISKQNADQIAVKHGYRKTQAYFNELRDYLVAVKYCKDAFDENDLENEIMFLTKTMPIDHPCYTACVRACVDDGLNVQWLALPFCSGGDLGSFLGKFPHAISLSFRWHVAHQLASALLFLLYGITDPSQTQPAPHWPHVSHSDIFLSNLLLAPNGRFGDFPDVIVADFGRATEYESENDDGYLGSQVFDIQSLGTVIDDMKETIISKGARSFHAGGEVVLEDCMNRLAQLGHLTDSQEAIALLQDVKAVAGVQRARYYLGMPADALAYLHAVKVSNEQLDASIWSTPVRA